MSADATSEERGARAAAIEAAVRGVLSTVPRQVTVVAAAKTRAPWEVEVALAAGLTDVGHNYVQEARAMVAEIRSRATWHMIGHLQRNKAAQAVAIFDCVQTLDSLRLAKELEKRAAAAGKRISILVEINSADEEAKSGVNAADAETLIAAAADMPHLEVSGLMTMGPMTEDRDAIARAFKTTRRLFERIAESPLSGVHMRTLSMGMSTSYRAAIDEGATMVRIGTAFFGPRT